MDNFNDRKRHQPRRNAGLYLAAKSLRVIHGAPKTGKRTMEWHATLDYEPERANTFEAGFDFGARLPHNHRAASGGHVSGLGVEKRGSGLVREVGEGVGGNFLKKKVKNRVPIFFGYPLME